MEVVGSSLPIITTLIISVWFLLFPRERSASLNFLGLFFLFFSITLFAILFQYLRAFYPVLQDYFHLFEMGFYAAMLTLPVLVFFYIISLTDYIKTYSTFDKFIPHFLIPLFSLIFNIYSLFYQSEGNDFIYRATDFFNFFSLKVIFVCVNIYYVISTIIIYKKHRSRLTHILSYDYGISFNWVLLFLLGYVLFVLCFFILNPNSSPFVIYLPLILIFIYLFFQRNTQVNISLQDEEIDPHFKEKEIIDALTEESTSALIDNEKRSKLKTRILRVMESKEPYLKKDLSIYDLSKMVKTNSSYLSFVLNNDFNLNFTSFINTYRVEKAKVYFQDERRDKYTIEAISTEVGFHSKSAFNAAFKNLTGLTPSKYRKSRIQ